MPSQRQSMLLDTIKPSEGGMGKSDHSRLKEAYGSHAKSVVSSGVVATSFPTGNGLEEKFITLHQVTYRAAYEAYVKSGEKHIEGSDFPEAGSSGASMNYSGAPHLGVAQPEGESDPGADGSTIVASGLGPNVNIHGSLGPAGSRVVVDGSTSPSSSVIDPYHAEDGKADPKKTSDSIANENTLPPGTLGSATSSGGE